MIDVFGNSIVLTKPIVITHHALNRFIERFSRQHDEQWFTSKARTIQLIHKNLENAEICTGWKTDAQEVERVMHLYGPTEVYKYNGIYYIISEGTNGYGLMTVVKHWCNEAKFTSTLKKF